MRTKARTPVRSAEVTLRLPNSTSMRHRVIAIARSRYRISMYAPVEMNDTTATIRGARPVEELRGRNALVLLDAETCGGNRFSRYARSEVNELCVNELGAEENDISRVNAHVLYYTRCR